MSAVGSRRKRSGRSVAVTLAYKPGARERAPSPPGGIANGPARVRSGRHRRTSSPTTAFVSLSETKVAVTERELDLEDSRLEI
jgi:hypothetical protein